MISQVLLKGIPDFLTPISPANEKNYTIVVLFVGENHKCSICESKFSNAFNLSKHLKNIHQSKTFVQCSYPPDFLRVLRV